MTEKKNTTMEVNENLQTKSQQAVELKTWNAPEIKELRTIYTNNGSIGDFTDAGTPSTQKSTS